ncbi:MAG: protein kinase domain-containing protein [Planctomycetota bacterium]
MTLSGNADDQELLLTLARRAFDLMDEGKEVDPAEICAAHPHLAGPLRDVLGLNDALPDLSREAKHGDPLQGMVLGQRYELSTCLGRGAMGVVYLAQDRELRREVAVKILDARLFRDEQAEARFQLEAEVLAALQHPNVVAVHDRGRTEEGVHFLVMERLAGTTLADLLRTITDGTDAGAAVAEALDEPPTERMWPRQVASWARDLAAALGTAHQRQLVHRDVKPSNVFVTRSGRPVLLDFGIATRQTDARLTATHMTLGTPWYMAPEQIGADPTRSTQPTLDVYGMGATLFHLLSKRPPYEGDVTTVLAALKDQDPPPLLQLVPDLPHDLAAITEKCLERNPDDRYRDGHELARDLDAFLHHQAVSARPIGTMARRLRQWRRAPARPLAILLTALLLPITVVALVYWQDERQRTARQQKLQLYATEPTLLAIEGAPHERALPAMQQQNEVAVALLDRILALDGRDLPARLRRASLLLDLDRRSEAVAEMRTIADQQGGAWFAALADRYARHDRDQQGVLAIDTDGLPAPATPEEHYAAGFLELRRRHVPGYAGRAEPLLRRAGEAFLPARGLRLLALASLAETTRDRARREAYRQELYDECVALEETYGMQTARTQTMRGTALLLAGDFAGSERFFLRSIELRPDRHPPHNNLAIAYRRLGRLADAERHLREAQRILPFSWRTKYTLAQVSRDLGKLEAAYQQARGLPDNGPPGADWRQSRLLASIALQQAMRTFRDDRAAARTFATRAADHLRKALAVRESATDQLHLTMLDAIASDAPSTSAIPFAAALLDDPMQPHGLRNLAFLLPAEGLDAAQTAWVAAILRKVAAELCDGNEALRQELLQEVEAGLQKFR